MVRLRERVPGAAGAQALSVVFLLVVCAAMGVLSTAGAANERPLMRFPDVSEDTIVFVYGEDIWSVPTAGGVATRLTIHDGEERFPKFSADGEWIAFTGEYD